jgi:glycosyltransferase EpsE
MCKVSVIMAAYNASQTILKAVNSIQEQSFTDWELIICDDCSSDNTWEILINLQKSDKRIKLIRNNRNMFAAYSRNRCLEMASGKYIAVQDADDYSHPDRLRICVDFLENNLEYHFVSPSAFFFDEENIWGERNLECGKRVSTDLVKGSCFIHAATLFRTEALKKVNGYRVDKVTRRGQDYDLFMRLYAAGFLGYTLNEKLYYIREDKYGYRRRKFKYRLDEARIRFEGYKSMKIPIVYYIYVLKPLIVGLIPNNLMLWIKKVLNKKY